MIHPPGFRGLKPYGCPDTKDDPVRLLLEEYESFRLADYLGMTQAEAAREMGVSRPTFTRIYESARQKIARAFVEVRTLRIEGGNVSPAEDWYHCTACDSMFGISGGRAGEVSCPVCRSPQVEQINTPEMPKPAAMKSGTGPQGSEQCICPKCGYTQKHMPGQPCRSKFCPECHVSLIREHSPHHQQLIKKLNNKS